LLNHRGRGTNKAHEEIKSIGEIKGETGAEIQAIRGVRISPRMYREGNSVSTSREVGDRRHIGAGAGVVRQANVSRSHSWAGISSFCATGRQTPPAQLSKVIVFDDALGLSLFIRAWCCNGREPRVDPNEVDGGMAGAKGDGIGTAVGIDGIGSIVVRGQRVVADRAT